MTQNEALESAAVAVARRAGLQARDAGASGRIARRITPRPASRSSAAAATRARARSRWRMHGVLFLDELPEFDRRVLEVLREPLESGASTSRARRGRPSSPREFQLVAAMNPCPCGFLGHYSEPLPLHAGPDRALPRAHLGTAARPHRPVPDRSAGACRRRCSRRCDDRAGESAAIRARVGAARERQMRAPGQAQREARRRRDRTLPAAHRPTALALLRQWPSPAGLVGARLPPRAEGRAHDRRPGGCGRRSRRRTSRRRSATGASTLRPDGRGGASTRGGTGSSLRLGSRRRRFIALVYP